MKPLPTIGFDRFIALSWMDLALAVASGEKPMEELLAALNHDIQGKEARSKTKTILNRMWLAPHPSVTGFVKDGIALYRQERDINILALHWGAALRSHPFFAAIAETIGRLLKLHGHCSATQVNRRLKELFGDRATVLRAAEAVLQTLAAWEVIEWIDIKKRVFIGKQTIGIKNKSIAIWLTEAGVFAAGKSVIINSNINSLFVFAIDDLSENDFSERKMVVSLSIVDGEILLNTL